jgi:hypothetical protein
MNSSKAIQKLNQMVVEEKDKKYISYAIKLIYELTRERKHLQQDNLFLRETISEQKFLIDKLFENQSINKEQFIQTIKTDFKNEVGFDLKHI